MEVVGVERSGSDLLDVLSVGDERLGEGSVAIEEREKSIEKNGIRKNTYKNHTFILLVCLLWRAGGVQK